MITDAESDWIVVSRGVPQGNFLGPLFYNLYVIDMNSTADRQIKQYADHTILHSTCENLELCISKLDNSARNLICYFCFHNLKIISEKTDFVVFG